jgi:hypothetical protein
VEETSFSGFLYSRKFRNLSSADWCFQRGYRSLSADVRFCSNTVSDCRYFGNLDGYDGLPLKILDGETGSEWRLHLGGSHMVDSLLKTVGRLKNFSKNYLTSYIIYDLLNPTPTLSNSFLRRRIKGFFRST